VTINADVKKSIQKSKQGGLTTFFSDCPRRHEMYPGCIAAIDATDPCSGSPARSRHSSMTVDRSICRLPVREGMATSDERQLSRSE
jgi:hypothetical protein